MSADLVGASSRTWLDTFGSDTSTLLSQASNALATGSRKASSRRRKSARLTSANGSSSWRTPDTENDSGPAGQAGIHHQARNWPTATGNPATYSNGERGPNLIQAAVQWPTPVANDDNKTPEGHLAKKPGRTVVTSLNIVATQMWPTPRSEDSESAGNHPNATDSLTGATGLWSTPHAHNSQGAPGAGLTANDGRHRDLVREAGGWQTPAVADGMGGHLQRGGMRANEPMLPGQAARWMTPTSRDWKDGADPSENVPTNSLLSRQAPRIMSDGQPSSGSAPTSRRRSASTKSGNLESDSRLLRRRLNPRFVAWLMGWNPGWTSLEPLNSGSLETGSCPHRQHSPFAPSGDNWPTPDTQNARAGHMRAEAHGKHAMSLHHVVEGWSHEAP